MGAEIDYDAGQRPRGLHVRSPKKTMYSRVDAESTLLERRRVIDLRRIYKTRQSRGSNVEQKKSPALPSEAFNSS